MLVKKLGSSENVSITCFHCIDHIEQRDANDDKFDETHDEGIPTEDLLNKSAIIRCWFET